MKGICVMTVSTTATELERISGGDLTTEEVFAICKILIESRAFNVDEFES